jgi:hypothetical protein
MIWVYWQPIQALVYMGSRKEKLGRDSIFLDELTLYSTFQILLLRRISNVIVLNAITNRSQNIYKWVLKSRRIDVHVEHFFSGYLKDEKGLAIPYKSYRLAVEITFKAAKEIIESSSVLSYLNDLYGRNTLKLYIAKKLHLDVEYWTHRILIAKKASKSSELEIWLKNPILFNEKLIIEAFPDVSIRFYKRFSGGVIKLIILWLINILRSIKFKYNFGVYSTGHSFPIKNNTPSALIFQENTNIRFDLRLRAQPYHWLYGKENDANFKTYLIETKVFKLGVTQEDKVKIKNKGVIFLSMNALYYSLKKNKNHVSLSKINSQKNLAVKAFFIEKGFIRKYFILQTIFLQEQAQMIGALSLWLNIKVFVNREPQNTYSDAIQLVSETVGVSTIAYQYSNMGSLSPIMMTTADKMLLFSEGYKKLYQFEGITPKNFVYGGYLYDGVSKYFEQKIQEHRNLLINAGAQFVICFFDETVQTGKWGLVGKNDHLSELHELSQFIIDNPNIGLVLKSQYLRFTPSTLYPDDELIQKAKNTGRYLELMEGTHRNEIYPVEAALVSDICISHKFGATAGLEAAVAGVKTVLLDTFGCHTIHDDIYNSADIIYEDMSSLLKALSEYKMGTGHPLLGDWSEILTHFDPYHDGKSVERLFDEINKSLN